jgi:hypothetical protein
MRLSRFTGAQITGVTKEKEAGLATVEVCRKHRLARQPEAAHGHGKPDNAILKDLLGKKRLKTPGRKCDMALGVMSDYQVWKRRACALIGVAYVPGS